MKWAVHCVWVVVCCSALGRPLFAAAPVPPEAPNLQALLRDRIEHGRFGTCIVAGTIDSTGRNVVSHGRLGRSNDRAADGDTVFEIGSVTKTFTGLLLAEMVKSGEVRLDEPVAELLPKSVKVPQRKGRQITLLDLATHTSGLPRLPDNLAPSDPANPYADYTPARLYAFLSRYVLPRDIGAKPEYSNLGVGLLGHALARRAGVAYESVVLRRICVPLGMKQTQITLSPELKHRLASGYGDQGQPAPNWDLGALAGAGGIRSTANDMLRFVAANCGLVKTDLAPAIELAQKPQRDSDVPGGKIGLCWQIAQRHGKTLVWHNGQTGGYHSFIGFDARNKRGVIVLINAAQSIDDIGFHLLDPESAVSHPRATTQRSAVDLAPEVLDRYVGRYELAPQVFFNVRRAGKQLQAQLTGQGYNSIYPESETEFFYRVVDAQITFVRDDHQRVTGLILHQNGRDQQARRTK
jgi:serine-type D-Ala-D-Ala carboxypeptidase/endopeptidase